MNKTEKIVISNNSDEPLLASREPWGEDYTLESKEEVEIITDCGQDFYYRLAYENKYVAVYAEVTVTGRESTF